MNGVSCLSPHFCCKPSANAGMELGAQWEFWFSAWVENWGKREGGGRKEFRRQDENAFWQLFNSELRILSQPKKFCLTQNPIFHLLLELFSLAVDTSTLNLRSLYKGAFCFHKAKAEKFYFWMRKLHSNLSTPCDVLVGLRHFYSHVHGVFPVPVALSSGKAVPPPARAACL